MPRYARRVAASGTPQQSKEPPMPETAPDILTALAHYKAQLEPYSKALWAMTLQERIAAMRRSELNMLQLYEWASRAPHEVPLLNGEFEFIATTMPEVADRGKR
jgi:hypothetical protein